MFCPRCGTWAPDGDAVCGLCAQPFHGAASPWPAEPAPPHTPAVAFVTYGGFWRRLAAALLDYAILFFPAATVRVLLGLPATGMFDPETSGYWTAAMFEFALDGLYATLFVCSPARGTLGMQVMDLHVTDLKGDRISFVRSAWRYVAQIFDLCTFGIGYLLQLFTPRRQALHDLVAGTVVVRPRPAHEPLPAPVMRMVP